MSPSTERGSSKHSVNEEGQPSECQAPAPNPEPTEGQGRALLQPCLSLRFYHCLELEAEGTVDVTDKTVNVRAKRWSVEVTSQTHAVYFSQIPPGKCPPFQKDRRKPHHALGWDLSSNCTKQAKTLLG